MLLGGWGCHQLMMCSNLYGSVVKCWAAVPWTEDWKGVTAFGYSEVMSLYGNGFRNEVGARCPWAPEQRGDGKGKSAARCVPNLWLDSAARTPLGGRAQGVHSVSPAPCDSPSVRTTPRGPLGRWAGRVGGLSFSLHWSLAPLSMFVEKGLGGLSFFQWMFPLNALETGKWPHPALRSRFQSFRLLASTSDMGKAYWLGGRDWS